MQTHRIAWVCPSACLARRDQAAIVGHGVLVNFSVVVDAGRRLPSVARRPTSRRVSPRWQSLVVALAVVASPGSVSARRAGDVRAASAGVAALPARAIDPAMPSSVPASAPPPVSVAPGSPGARSPHEVYDELLRDLERRKADEQERARADRMLSTGAILVAGALLQLGLGALLRVRYAQWEPRDRDECEMFCFGYEPPVARGTVLFVGGGAMFAAGLTLLGIGGYRAARPSLQRTALGTWTTGFSLRF